MKVTTSDLLAILRRFNLANDDNVPRHIEHVKQTHPSPINQMVAFRFNRTHYFALFDETAEDDRAYILHQIQTAKSDAHGELLKNPTSHLDTYGLPFKGKDVYLFELRSDKQRLDILLATKYPDTSRSTWQKHIKAGHINVNGEVISSTKYEVAETDDVVLHIPKSTDHDEKTMPIIYLDDNIIVVDKPAGVLTHSKGALNDEFTVADFFRRYTQVGLDTNRPGIVHRLDRDTSGVIVGALNDASFDLLKHQFAERKAKKQYIAVLDGIPKSMEATIDVPIGRNPTAPSTFRADSKGKSAVTDYQILATDGKRSLVLLMPRTGRTHQLRVHMAYLGTPIIGDRVYGKPGERLFLHASSLEITVSYEMRRTFESALPAVFNDVFEGAVEHAARLSS
jgi:23S rRNA pseudouridine1911/1915/1917 synthase